MNKEVTPIDILEFLQEHMVMKPDIEAMVIASEKRLESRLEGKITESEQRLETKIRESEHRLRDHLDDKLIDLKGDLIAVLRKEDRKVDTLIEILQANKTLSAEEVKKLQVFSPFPQVSS